MTFQPPRGCQICHHQEPKKSDCTKCHDSLPAALTRALTVQTHAPKAPERFRLVAFSHSAHDTLTCLDCHTTPVTMEPKPDAANCQGCHDLHHAPGRTCATCHWSATTQRGHTRESHIECTACHQAQTVGRLSPTRTFCLTCHDSSVDHRTDRQCTECHMLATPDEFRQRLGSTTTK